MSEEILLLRPGATAEALESGDMTLALSKSEVVAREIMGPENFFGKKEIENALGIEIDTKNIPQISFTKEELIRAKQLGDRLILRVSHTKDGTPLAIKFLNDHMLPKLQEAQQGAVFIETNSFADEPFFIQDTPRTRWSLVSNDLIKYSTSKNYLNQTEEMSDYLKDVIYKHQELPQKYADAIAEFDVEREGIEMLLQTQSDESQKTATEKLAQLKINLLTRPSAVEVLYDVLVYFRQTNKRLLQYEYAWTSTRSSANKFVRIGDFDIGGSGMRMLHHKSSGVSPYVGTLVSR